MIPFMPALHPSPLVSRLRTLILILPAFCLPAAAQNNFEIQVYPSETIEPHQTMVELHSNFTFQGSKNPDDGTRPTEHAWHETLEITHGINDWFETGFYLFTAARPGDGWQFVGTHLRPRVRVPAKLK
jgi:hypothetical protein